MTRSGLIVATSVIAGVLVLAPGCSGNDEGGGNASEDGSGGSIGTGGSLGTGGLGIGSSSGSGSLMSCASDSDCESGEVCHPFVEACVAPGSSCSGNGDCSPGAYCDEESSVCLPGLPGSPCEASEECQAGSECTGGICACSGFILEQEQSAGPLDIYFIFDRTGSMGSDCDYEVGAEPPVNSKACFATYAMSDYLINVSPATDTRLAFQFMSYPDGCDGGPYSTPLVELTPLPVASDHQIITEISDESFQGGSGTQIEGALIGIANFTTANETPGREMIGVLMTDGDPNGCEEDIDQLAQIISDHRQATGIRTFIIGMDGATEDNLETLAIAGGAEPHDDFCGSLDAPCHYWNVGDGSEDAIANALNAIVTQATPFPCEYDLSDIQPLDGSQLDLSTLNIQLSQGGEATIIGKVDGESACPKDQYAWYYDDNAAPSSLNLCENACDFVTAAEEGATMSIVGGCSPTVVLR